jgi:Flp pilus assembly pilin Flp
MKSKFATREHVAKSLQEFLANDAGNAAVEYATLLALVVAVLMPMVQVLGERVSNIGYRISAELEGTGNGPPSEDSPMENPGPLANPTPETSTEEEQQAPLTEPAPEESTGFSSNSPQQPIVSPQAFAPEEPSLQ